VASDLFPPYEWALVLVVFGIILSLVWRITSNAVQKAQPSVLWHCWLGVRKSIWPVKSWVMGYWH